MSADLIQRLASSGMTLHEAAYSVGMPYHQFRQLRSMYPEIVWARSKAQRKSLAWKHKITAEIAQAIRDDPRSALELAKVHGLSRSTVYNIRAGRTWKTE